MYKYFQVGLVLAYAWGSVFAFLLMLRLSGVYISTTAGWLGMAGWIFFCFSSPYFMSGIWLSLRGKCRKPILEEEEKLQRCLCDVLAKASCGKSFRLMIRDGMEPRATAAGRRTIIVTRGMLERTTDDELKGVLAHELGHLMDKDTIVTLVFSMARLLPLIMIRIGNNTCWILRRGFFISGRVQTSIGLLKIGRFSLLNGILLLFITGYLLYRIHLLQVVIPFIGFVLLLSIFNAVFEFLFLLAARLIEYKQDAYAYRLGFGPGLRQALQKLAADDPEQPDISYIILKSRHPVIYNRIRRLEKLESYVNDL